MVLRENMMTLPSDMNSDAAKTDLTYSMRTANVQYHVHQAEMNITDEGPNPSLFSGFNPIQHQLSASSNLDSMMVEELLNPVSYNNQALPQPLPATYPAALHTECQYNMHSHNAYDPAPLPAPANATYNPVMACINNNVASLMASNGDPNDTIGFEQFLVDFKVVHPGPQNPPSAVGNVLRAAPVPPSNHNQIIQTQGQHFLQRTPILSFANNAANGGVIQMPKRRRELNPDEAMNRRMHRIIKNRESAARSRARKSAHDKEMQVQLNKLKEENDKLKKILEMKAETKNGDKKLKRTKSWP